MDRFRPSTAGWLNFVVPAKLTLMNIVVLDGYTLNPGDLSWEELRSLGSAEIHDRTPPAETVRRALDADILLTNKTSLDREHLQQLPRLKYIGVLATGTNVVDLAAARERGITVTNAPAYGTASVAQTTMALLLELTQRVGHHAQTVREGKWARSLDWSYWDYPLVELAGLTLGIVGFGRIGGAVAGLGAAFGMNVLAYNPSSRPPQPGVRFVDLDTLFRQGDVVSLHCPLTAQNRNLVNAERLSSMKPGAFLLNTSRGPLVDEGALAAALNSGRIAGAGLDVLSEEPPPGDHPLYSARNCFVTPHLSWGTLAARRRLLQIVVENIRSFVGGRAQNVVN